MESQTMAGEVGRAPGAGRIVYERARLASELLVDPEWVRRYHGADQRKAYDRLTAVLFADLGGLATAEEMVGLYRSVPEAKWAECRWDVRRLLAEWRASH
jgi:class 3 adenylate cyclase